MKKYFSLLSLIMVVFVSNSQIEMSKEATKENKKKEKKKEAELPEGYVSSTEVYFQGNWSSTNRKLIPNDGFFGDSLGERANETSIGAWSAGIGLRNSINKWLTWEGGISFFQNGENYLFESDESDSLFTYKNNYMYIGMPLKLFYTYGNKIQLMVGAGVVPQMFLQYRQTSSYQFSDGTPSEQEIVKTKIGYNSFVMSAVLNLGVKYKASDRVSLYVMPEYKYQLTSSYDKKASYKHYGRSLGLNFGLSIAF